MSWVERVNGLPGAELVVPGVADLAARRETAESLLVEIARGRLVELGVPVQGDSVEEAAELRLYAHLCAQPGGDPYSAYNALLRRLDKLIRVLEAEGGCGVGSPDEGLGLCRPRR